MYCFLYFRKYIIKYIIIIKVLGGGKMQFWQLGGEVAVLLIVAALLNSFLSQFKTSRKSFYLIFFIPILFSVGFGLRLSQNKEIVDFGFFLTEISYLFTYLLFTAALMLGQKKYWKIS